MDLAEGNFIQIEHWVRAQEATSVWKNILIGCMRDLKNITLGYRGEMLKIISVSWEGGLKNIPFGGGEGMWINLTCEQTEE